MEDNYGHLEIRLDELLKRIENTLCDNIIYAKYSTFQKIKDQYDFSLLRNFGIYDDSVEDHFMHEYLEIAINHLYHKDGFEKSFEKIFLSFTENYKDYTHIDDRLCKIFLPDLLLEEYKPSSNLLGLRLKTLTEADIIKAKDQIDAYNNSDFCNTPDFHLNKEIIRISSPYIVEPEKIARKTHKSSTYICLVIYSF